MKQLHPRAVWLFFISSIFRWLFAMVFLTIWTSSMLNENISTPSYIGLIVLGFIILLALLFIWAKLSYHYYRYELTDNGFRKESGVINKKYVTIPYDRIQNVDIHRNILARLFGLSDLQVQTAGASAQVSRSGVFGVSAEGRLPGLWHADAELLRDELIHRAKQSRSQGL